jgi:hypothetical protein
MSAEVIEFPLEATEGPLDHRDRLRRNTVVVTDKEVKLLELLNIIGMLDKDERLVSSAIIKYNAVVRDSMLSRDVYAGLFGPPELQADWDGTPSSAALSFVLDEWAQGRRHEIEF